MASAQPYANGIFCCWKRSKSQETGCSRCMLPRLILRCEIGQDKLMCWQGCNTFVLGRLEGCYVSTESHVFRLSGLTFSRNPLPVSWCDRPLQCPCGNTLSLGGLLHQQGVDCSWQLSAVFLCAIPSIRADFHPGVKVSIHFFCWFSGTLHVGHSSQRACTAAV